MIKIIFPALIVILLVSGIFIGKNYLVKKDETIFQNTSKEKKVSSVYYWTCPMHPEINRDGPGECPICHMKLIKIEKKLESNLHQHIEDPFKDTEFAQNIDGGKTERASVFASKKQLDLLGVQKIEVEKMNLVINISVSGRVISENKVAFQIYENDLRYIGPGLKFTGEGGVYTDGLVSGEILSVDSIADPTSRTVRVVGLVKNKAHKLLPETSFSGVIKIELKNKLAIPQSSVLHTGKGDFVYLIGKEGKLSAQKVSLGMKSESFFEVLKGLTVGDVISSGPNFLIDSEAKIRGVRRN